MGAVDRKVNTHTKVVLGCDTHRSAFVRVLFASRPCNAEEKIGCESERETERRCGIGEKRNYNREKWVKTQKFAIK